jgi:hypothetical protein
MKLRKEYHHYRIKARTGTMVMQLDTMDNAQQHVNSMRDANELNMDVDDAVFYHSIDGITSGVLESLNYINWSKNTYSHIPLAR